MEERRPHKSPEGLTQGAGGLETSHSTFSDLELMTHAVKKKLEFNKNSFRGGFPSRTFQTGGL